MSIRQHEEPNPTTTAPPTPQLVGTPHMPARPRKALIATIWAVTGFLLLAGFLFDGIFPFSVNLTIDLVLWVMAIILICSPGKINKWNGVAKIVFDIVLGTLLFIRLLRFV